MDITSSKQRYENAANGFDSLKKEIRMNAGEATLDYYMRPTKALVQARSELVRDVVTSHAQRVIELEALKFMAMSPEERATAAKFLAEQPEVFLRRLVKTVVETCREVPVGTKLSEVLRALEPSPNWAAVAAKEETPKS